MKLMVLVNSFAQNINLPGSMVNTDNFKDNFVDKVLDIRDAIHDKHGVFPIIGVSANTYNWMKRLFFFFITFLETVDKTIFCGCELRRLDMRDGLFDFYITE